MGNQHQSNSSEARHETSARRLKRVVKKLETMKLQYLENNTQASRNEDDIPRKDLLLALKKSIKKYCQVDPDWMHYGSQLIDKLNEIGITGIAQFNLCFSWLDLNISIDSPMKRVKSCENLTEIGTSSEQKSTQSPQSCDTTPDTCRSYYSSLYENQELLHIMDLIEKGVLTSDLFLVQLVDCFSSALTSKYRSLLRQSLMTSTNLNYKQQYDEIFTAINLFILFIRDALVLLFEPLFASQSIPSKAVKLAFKCCAQKMIFDSRFGIRSLCTIFCELAFQSEENVLYEVFVRGRCSKPDDFGVKSEYQLYGQLHPFEKTIAYLQDLRIPDDTESFSYLNELDRISRLKELIESEIDSFYTSEGVSNVLRFISTDDLIDILCYCVVKSANQKLYCYLMMIEKLTSRKDSLILRGCVFMYALQTALTYLVDSNQNTK